MQMCPLYGGGLCFLNLYHRTFVTSHMLVGIICKRRTATQILRQLFQRSDLIDWKRLNAKIEIVFQKLNLKTHKAFS